EKISSWLPFRQLFLDELLSHNGLGDTTADQKCPGCDNVRTVHCQDRSDECLHCTDCIITRHASFPLHCICRGMSLTTSCIWISNVFDKITLRELGLIYQLGHAGASCSDPSPPCAICICDINGVHLVNVHFCQCGTLKNGIIYKWQQLLHTHFFSASTTWPQTAFTFDILDFFHELTLQGKMNLYDFYQTLQDVTDNSGSCNLLVRLITARGHDPARVEAMQEGELTVECLACPHPDCNLPAGWESAPSDHLCRWLYALFLMVDANFHIHCKDKGLTDNHLAPRWAYFVEESKYLAHVECTRPSRRGSHLIYLLHHLRI
ncbi:uncharacterized protein LAESUDRAFT_640833, partial [Laetiporus sulphureus 93-53]